MKKISQALLVTLALITLNNTALSMDPPQAQPLINVQGHLIPSEYSLSINPHALFSSVGAFAAYLGVLLLYQGAQKTAQQPPLPTTLDLNPQPQPAVEGRWLMGQGSVLALAGILAIFHKSLLGLN